GGVGVEARGGGRLGSGGVGKGAPHAAAPPARRKTAFTCSKGSDSRETFVSEKETAGTSLFKPLAIPASSQPVDMLSTRSPAARSMDGPHDAPKTLSAETARVIGRSRRIGWLDTLPSLLLRRDNFGAAVPV